MNKWLNPRSAFGIALITIALLRACIRFLRYVQ